MDFNRLGTVVGFIVCVVVVMITIIRQRRFELTDLGPYAASFLAGTNLPAALFLCTYALYPDSATVATKLHGMERFVSFAGLSLLLVTLLSIYGLCRNAYQQAPAPTAAAEPQAAPALKKTGEQDAPRA